jgi:hypothetical protein
MVRAVAIDRGAAGHVENHQHHAGAGMTEADLFAIEDIWINAFAAVGRIKLTTDAQGVFDGGAGADPHPDDLDALAKLLRSDTPMTRNARNTLAELFSPGEPPLYNWKLVPQMIKKIDPIGKQLDAVATFEKNRNEGMTAEDAADQTGIRGGRQVHRYRRLLESLGRRLRGED